jgi:anti-anti-sigma regulatory factor
MSFELTISVMRAPRACGICANPIFGHPSYASITLNGILDPSAADEILRAVSEVCRGGSDPVLVEMEDVDAGDRDCLRTFAADLTALRETGLPVQLMVREPALHAALTQLPHSSEWLLHLSNARVDGPRCVLHVEGPDAPA